MKKYVAHPLGLAAFIAGALLLLSLEIIYLVLGNFLAMAVFLCLLILFTAFHVNLLCSVHLDERTVSKTFFGFQGLIYHWSELQEVGILYPSVMKRLAKNKRPSRCVIYFSPKKLSSEERLKACLNWPPKDIIEMGYTPARLQEVIRLWDKRLIFFNITSQELFGGDAKMFDIDTEEIRY